jgi:hypothetical protein
MPRRIKCLGCQSVFEVLKIRGKDADGDDRYASARCPFCYGTVAYAAQPYPKTAAGRERLLADVLFDRMSERIHLCVNDQKFVCSGCPGGPDRGYCETGRRLNDIWIKHDSNTRKGQEDA